MELSARLMMPLAIREGIDADQYGRQAFVSCEGG
jgi:hypothetical protein